MFTLFLLLVGLAATLGSPVQRTVGGRIVGGRDGTIEEVPYLVSVRLDEGHICGATIISEYWVVSAAHCFESTADRYSIRAGSTSRTEGGSIHAIEYYLNHENYGTPNAYSNDISLLKLATPLEFSDAIQPASLPETSQELETGTWSTISGWGRLRFLIGAVPIIVQIAEVPIVSVEQCRSSYGTASIGDDMLCAGLDVGGVDACQGDSGGPLVVDGTLWGVVSWGYLCASAGYPGVYADTSYFRDWITENSGV